MKNITLKNKVILTAIVLFFSIMAIITLFSCLNYKKSAKYVDLVIPHADKIKIDEVKTAKALAYEGDKEGYTHNAIVHYANDEFFSKLLIKTGATFPGVDISGDYEENMKALIENMKALIENIKQKEDGYYVTLAFNSPDTLVGDEVHILFRGETERELANLVPRSAVCQASDDFYVVEVIEEDGPWGKEYITKRKFVMVSDGNEDYVKLFGYSLKYPLVLSPDDQWMDGTRVKFFMSDK